MFANRLVRAVVGIAFVMAAAITFQSAVATAPTVSGVKDLSDYALRHPNAVIRVSMPDLSDYALRHPGARIVVESRTDLSDYALRHPDARIVMESMTDLSDYALGHPDARIMMESTPDLSDYALRHPALMHRATPDLSDWFLRHPDATISGASDTEPSDSWLRQFKDLPTHNRRVSEDILPAECLNLYQCR